MKNLFIVLAASLVFISCNSGSNTDVAAPASTYKFPEAQPLPANTVLSNDSLARTANPVTTTTTAQPIPVKNPTVSALPNTNVAQPNVSVTQSSAPVGKGMNPEHGKPGHRCDIPVGTPLNAPAANLKPQVVQQPQVQQTPVQTVTTTPSPLQTQTAPGMNPPHGQPGHDCAIEVGKPLKKAQ